MRTDGLKDASEGVVRGDTVGQFEEAPEEVFLGVGEFLDFDEVVAAAQHGAKTEDQNVYQPMAQVLALPPGIGDRLECVHQARPLFGCHLWSSLTTESAEFFTDLADNGKRKSLSSNHLKCARPASQVGSPTRHKWFAE
jgi:hypothetical protein